MILHIPHASSVIPDQEGYLDVERQTQEIHKLTDWYTDDLFDVDGATKIVAPFSRVFCDVERFEQDADEPMASKGMGLAYTTCDDGRPLRVVNESLRSKIVEGYYRKHHQQLTDAVDNALAFEGRALIIDGHSFSDLPFIRDVHQLIPRPDFNIGIDLFHTPADWITGSVRFFEEKEYTLGVDWPYSGTIVPIEHLKKNKQVHSIMLEVNRDLYMDADLNKSANYHDVKKLIKEWMNRIIH